MWEDKFIKARKVSTYPSPKYIMRIPELNLLLTRYDEWENISVISMRRLNNTRSRVTRMLSLF